jgi:hypothetical protein
MGRREKVPAVPGEEWRLSVRACPRCGGRLRLIATVKDPEAIRAILAALSGSREREGSALPGAAGEFPVPRWCSAPQRHTDAAVAEVCSLASWARHPGTLVRRLADSPAIR